jgi:hypothetical protein
MLEDRRARCMRERVYALADLHQQQEQHRGRPGSYVYLLPMAAHDIFFHTTSHLQHSLSKLHRF